MLSVPFAHSAEQEYKQGDAATNSPANQPTTRILGLTGDAAEDLWSALDVKEQPHDVKFEGIEATMKVGKQIHCSKLASKELGTGYTCHLRVHADGAVTTTK